MPEITGLLLGAGQSRRFGSQKLLHIFNGCPLILHSAASLSPCDRIVAVVRQQDEALQRRLRDAGIDCVINQEAEQGMGNSIACGVRATPKSHAWCLLPADMPCVSESTTQQIVNRLREGAQLTAPFYDGRRGHPVGFSRSFRAQLSGLKGETGARNILMSNVNDLVRIDIDDPGIIIDIDTPQDLRIQGMVQSDQA